MNNRLTTNDPKITCWSMGFKEGRDHALDKSGFNIGSCEDLSPEGWEQFIRGYVAGYEVGEGGF